MAVVPSPPINTSGNPPTVETVVITQTTNGLSTPAGGLGYALGYTRAVLPVPSPDLQLNEPGTGYPF
jgi:hypothetical protein